jgi:hypothetical protein
MRHWVQFLNTVILTQLLPHPFLATDFFGMELLGFLDLLVVAQLDLKVFLEQMDLKVFQA